MKELPILFSGPMVKAILDGRKTMTRRVIKGAPGIMLYPQVQDCGVPIPELIEAYKNAWLTTCPYGQPGDRLWVREAWAIRDCKPLFAAIFRADCVEDDSSERDGWWIDKDRKGEEEFIPGKVEWKPSIFMPRWASRITLEITAVRVERVQDIGDEDAEAEGLSWCNAASPRDKFQCLWNSLNAKRGYGWEANPWVWVIAFKRVK